MTYRDLLATAQADPLNADYHTLRMAYARSDEYAPYIEDAENIQALGRALPARDFDAALAAINNLLAFNYLDIEAHLAASYVHIQREAQSRATYHRQFGHGLLQAIRATGSGQDFDTATIVLSIAEEHTVIRSMGLIATGQQRLVEQNGHWFDILNAREPDTGVVREMVFNVDIPRQWLDDQQGN